MCQASLEKGTEWAKAEGSEVDQVSSWVSVPWVVVAGQGLNGVSLAIGPEWRESESGWDMMVRGEVGGFYI